jgi:hypothetical protein
MQQRLEFGPGIAARKLRARLLRGHMQEGQTVPEDWFAGYSAMPTG